LSSFFTVARSPRLSRLTRDALREKREFQLKEEGQFLEWLDQTMEFPPAKQQEFAVTANSVGLSG
jgi:hypothetical protein